MTPTPSHTPLIVSGLEVASVIDAMATYLIGCIAGAIGFDARVSAAVLVNEIDAELELNNQVAALIGSDNVWDTEEQRKFRDTRRNAWIAEGISHAIIVIHRRRATSLLGGPVIGLSLLHTIPSEPGLDAVGIYLESNQTVILVGESKATQNRGSQELGKAVTLFNKIDKSQYGPELRSHLTSLRQAVPEEHRLSISDSLWRERRAYLPFITHEKPFPLTRNRRVIQELEPVVNRKRLVSIKLLDFHKFFDCVADAMRTRVALDPSHV